MMRLRNKIKEMALGSSFLPAVYSFCTMPFSMCFDRSPVIRKKIVKKYKVSAIVPNFNYARFLELRINSILNQTYRISELIILDDCSTDDSLEIIKAKIREITERFPNIKTYSVINKKNSGKSIKQWEKAFSLASGDFIWICEADDLSNRHFLSEVLPSFDDDRVVIAYSNSRAIDKNGFTMMYDVGVKSVDNFLSKHWNNSYKNNGIDEIRNYLSIKCSIPNVSAAVFRNIKTIPFQTYLKEAEKFTQIGDWYFYVNVLRHGKISYVRESLNRFRIHSDSVTNDKKKSNVQLEEIKWMHKYISKNFNINPDIKKKMQEEITRVQSR